MAVDYFRVARAWTVEARRASVVLLSRQLPESCNFQVLSSRLLVAGADPGWRCCKGVGGRMGLPGCEWMRRVSVEK